MLEWIASGVIVILGWYQFCRYVGDAVRPESKQDLAQVLQQRQFLEGLHEWPDRFNDAFDSIFGQHHFSWKCFLRSCVASLATIAFMCLAWAWIRPEAWEATRSYFFTFGELATGFVGSFFLWVFVLNLIPDYISLYETRWVLGMMSDRSTTRAIFLLIVLDLVLTVGLAVLMLSVGTVAMAVLQMQWEEQLLRHYSLPPTDQLPSFGWQDVPDLIVSNVLQAPLLRSVSSPRGGVELGIFFYSTFLTSVWSALFAVIFVSTRGLMMVGQMGETLKERLDIDDRPFRALGVLGMPIIAMLFAVILLVRIVS